MRYVITGRAAAIHSGVLELTKEQARRRLHNLKDLGRGRYEVVKPVEFKHGEEIGYDGDIPKAMGDLLEPVDKEAAGKKKKAKADAEAKAKADAPAGGDAGTGTGDNQPGGGDE